MKDELFNAYYSPLKNTNKIVVTLSTYNFGMYLMLANEANEKANT